MAANVLVMTATDKPLQLSMKNKNLNASYKADSLFLWKATLKQKIKKKEFYGSGVSSVILQTGYVCLFWELPIQL